jgi:hypothetical protein
MKEAIMALTEGDRKNFETLLRAARNGDLALVESKDAKTGEYRALICAVKRMATEVEMVPFGHLSQDPYADYLPPGFEEDSVVDPNA